MRIPTIIFILFLSLTVVAQVDVTHQSHSLKADWRGEALMGSTTLTMKLLKQTEALRLDGKSLAIARVEAKERLEFEYDPEAAKDNLVIKLDRAYEEGEELEVTIYYQTKWINETDPNNIWGSLGEGVRFFEPSTTEPGRQQQLWTVGEPEGNQLWFPGNFDPTDFRTTELSLTVEKPLLVLSNGTLQSVEDHGDGTRTYHWKTEVPHPAHLTSMVVGKYLSVTQAYEDVEIISYCYPHEADATAATAERLPDMMQFYSEVTGVKYPYATYSQVFVQEFAGWQGNLMTSTITENMVDDWVTHKDFRWLWDIVESEALASQWYGVHLVPATWRDAWLAKGLSRHLAGLYNEYKNSRQEYLSYQYNPQLTTYLTDWNAGTIQPVAHASYEDATTFVRSNHPYRHGATVLHMLRKEVGEEAWFGIIKAFTTRYAGKMITTEDFLDVVNEEAGGDLTWFFDQWVYGVGHPVFDVQQEWDANRKELTMKVEQVQRLDTLETRFKAPKYFQGTLLVELDDQVEAIRIEAKRENVYTFQLAAAPRFVNFDFESGWAKEERFDRSQEEWKNQLLYSKDILARMAALSQLGTLAGAGSKEEKEQICEAMRMVIQSPNTYWRLKMLALWQLQGLLVKNGKLTLDESTKAMLLEVIEKEESWVKSSAVWFLGMTQDPIYADFDIDLFDDWSDRVTNAAAIALGKTKSPKAYDALMALQEKPSWKNQSLISALNGLQWLSDDRGVELALASLQNNEAKHWTLSTPIWDHRLAAGNTLSALGAAKQGYDFIAKQLQAALEEQDLNDVLYNVLQLVNLADPRGKELFAMLKEAYAEDTKVLSAIEGYEKQFLGRLE